MGESLKILEHFSVIFAELHIDYRAYGWLDIFGLVKSQLTYNSCAYHNLVKHQIIPKMFAFSRSLNQHD